jgi:drug/metabolite transporter (DMT)-like permease
VVLFYLFLFLVRRWTASATSYLFVLFPFVTVVLAAWLAHETVTAAFLGGGVLVLVGVWVGTLARP